MTPAEAAAALFQAIPKPITTSQLQEYGIEVSDSTIQRMAREILSLNLYWAFAAIDAHIPNKYRSAIKETLVESIQKEWWATGLLGDDTWNAYQLELTKRRERYTHLVDQKGINHIGICVETASLIEDQGIISSEDHEKLLVLLIDHAPASEYGSLLDEAG